MNGAACGSSGKPNGGAGGVAGGAGGADGGGVGGTAGTDGGGSDARTSFTLGGEAIGIVGTGMMITSGTETLALTHNGRFVFTMALSNGAAYSVTVAGQPKNPTQSCYILNGSGKIAGADIENVIIKCLPLHARYVLVADRSDNSVSTYAVVDPTGRLTFIGKAAAGAGAAAVAVGSFGRSAYVANATDGTVSQYTVGADGALAAMTPATVMAGSGVRGLALDPAGHFAYAVNPGSGDVTAYSVAAGGALTRIGATTAGTTPQAIAIDPGGQFVYVANAGGNNISQFKVGTDGMLVPMTPPAVASAGAAPRGIAVEPTGRFAYAVSADDAGSVSQFAVGATGALSPLAPPAFSVGASPTAIRIDPTGHFAYVTRGGSGSGAGTIAQLVIGPGGTLSSLSPATTAVEADPQGLAVDGSGGTVYVAGGSSNSVSVFDIIPTTGALAPNQLPRVAGQVSPSSVAIVSGDAPVQVVPKFAYAANNGSESISLYTVGASGALTILSSLDVTGTGPQAVAVDPSSHYLYVSNTSDTSLSQYSIGTDGKLTALIPDRVDAGTLPVAIAFHPSGRFAYVANGSSRNLSQYAVAADGTLTALTPATLAVSTNVGPSGVVADPTGRYVFVSISTGNVAQFSVGVDGTLSPLSPATVPAAMNSNSIAISPSGTALFVANSSSNNISQYAIGAGGKLSPITPAAAATGMFPAALAIDPSGRWLYSANTNSAEVGLFSIGSSGALAPLSPSRVAIGTASVNTPTGIVVDPSGHYAYVSDSVDPTGMVWQFTIGATGALTPMTPPSVPAGVVPQSIAIAGRYQ